MPRLKRNVSCLFVAILALVGCIRQAEEADSGGGGAELSGEVLLDGSSTVYPIAQAAAEEFMSKHRGVKVSVGVSGTGGGFKRFVVGETDISNASRPIKESEIEACRKNGIEYVELKLAIDGLSVVVNPENDWCDCLSVPQLRAIWEPGSKIHKWSDVNPDWPDEPIALYGADTDSGTFDYFTEVICGEDGRIRTDYSPSTDDNVLVRGVSGDKYALGFFGYAYYAENTDKVKAIGVAPEDDLDNCIKPTPETIESGRYRPLSRPLFLYVNTKSLAKPQVRAFVEFCLSEEGQELVSAVKYVRLSKADLEASRKALAEALSQVVPEK